MSPVSELFVFLGLHPDGSEGVVGGVHNGVPRPLMAVTRELADGLLETAQVVADYAGTPVRMVRFTVGEELLVIEPTPQDDPGPRPPLRIADGPEGDGR